MAITENKGKQGKPTGLPKTGGRQKGTLNKKSYWLREQLADVNFNWAADFKESMNCADYERVDRLIALLPYLNPKIEPRKIDADDTGPSNDDLNVNISLNGLVLSAEKTSDQE